MKIDIRRVKYHPGPIWHVCGQDNDYGLFHNIRPRQLAIKLIHDVFTDEEIARRKFVYIPTVYRGRQSMQDEIIVYQRKKII